MTPEEKLIVERLKRTYGDVEEMEKVFDIVVNTLALREAEIERLKRINVSLVAKERGFREEIERLKKELAFQTDMACQAADALEKFNYIDGHSVRDLHIDDLIDELRKAAQ